MSSTTIPKTLDIFREWFSSHFIPLHIMTDNSAQFTDEEFENFTKRNGIKQVMSAPYPSASKCFAE